MSYSFWPIVLARALRAGFAGLGGQLLESLNKLHHKASAKPPDEGSDQQLPSPGPQKGHTLNSHMN